MIIRKKDTVLKVLITMYSVLTLLFSISLVSPSSQISTIPDICLPYNTQYYDLYLDQYYDIDLSETIEIDYIDPDTGRSLSLPNGYATLDHQTCFEMAHYFHNGRDLVRIETFDDDCDFDLTIRFSSDSNLDQTFNIDVEPSCADYIDPNETYYNISSNVFQDAVAMYNFDDNLYDYIGIYDAEYTYWPTFHSSGKYGKALKMNESNVNIDYAFTQIYDENYSVSYWVKASSACNQGSTIFACNNEKHLAIYTGSGVDWLITKGGDEGGVAGLGVGLKNDIWHHFVIINNNTDWSVYINGTYSHTFTGDPSDLKLENCYFGDVQYPRACNDNYIDDFILYNRTLTASDVAELWNSGNGYDFSAVDPTNTPSSSNTTNVYMYDNETISIDLNDYFSDWEDIYIEAPNPYGVVDDKLYTGYHTVNGDYYELKLYNNGTLDITSYFRTYHFNVTMYACHYNPYESCVSETLFIYINNYLPQNVTLLQTMQAYYDLGFDNPTTLQANTYFANYDTVTFSFPETNNSYPDFGHVGPLNGSWEYTEIPNPTNNASYMVHLSCVIDQDYYTYNYLGDLNITVQCGENRAAFVLTPYNNYNQKTYMTATNQWDSAAQNTTILAGNYQFPSGYIPSDIEPNSSGLENHIFAFSNLLPNDISNQNKTRLVFFVILIIVGVIFSALYKYSVPLAFYTSLVIIIFLLFMFVNANYISPVYPILFLFILMSLLIIKFIRGGV